MYSRETEKTSNNKTLRTRDDLTIEGLEELTSNIAMLTSTLEKELKEHWLKPADVKEALQSLQEVKIPENNSNILKKYTAVFKFSIISMFRFDIKKTLPFILDLLWSVADMVLLIGSSFFKVINISHLI